MERRRQLHVLNGVRFCQDMELRNDGQPFFFQCISCMRAKSSATHLELDVLGDIRLEVDIFRGE